jgi:energy-coupling factor transporter ATP-binding protein EcfA2
MLSELEIRKFRAFKELYVRDLSQVNLFVGRNNSGKTTILEAAEILLSTNIVSAVVGCATRRGEIYIQRELDRAGRYVDLSHLFYGHECEVGSEFQIKGVELNNKYELKCVVLPSDVMDNGGKTFNLFSEDDTLEPRLVLSIHHSRSNEPIIVPIAFSGAISIDFVRRQAVKPNSGEKPVSFVRTEALDSFELQEFWDSIALTEEESNIIESLRILEPMIERIAFLSSRYYRLASSSGGIYVKLRNLESRVPLGSLGDGIRHLLTISSAVSRSSQGFVMIDEIDTGLHHSVMSDMWHVLIATAKRLDVQLFATTHSLDCVRSLAWLSSNEPNLCEGVRLHRVDEQRDRTVVYTPNEISIAAEQHVELRG